MNNFNKMIVELTKKNYEKNFNQIDKIISDIENNKNKLQNNKNYKHNPFNYDEIIEIKVKDNQ